MLFVGIEDLTGSSELLVFARTLEKYPDLFEEGVIFLAEGKLSHKDNQPKILLSTIKKLDPSNLRIPKNHKSIGESLKITIPQGVTTNKLSKLKKTLIEWKGEDLCTIKLPDQKEITLQAGVTNCQALQEEIKKILA